jgi:hypothetical protein
MTTLKVSESLAKEHDELFHELRNVVERGDAIGKTANGLLTALEPHFEKENETAMPLLGVLEPLSKGGPTHRTEVVRLYDELASEYPRMLKEHARIRNLIGSVRRVASKKKDADVPALMRALEHHAAVEEEILYPAALLAGFIVKAGVEVSAR